MSAIGTHLAVEAALRLGTLIDAHARDAGRQLGEWLRPWLRDGETLPDFTLVLELPARMIRQTCQRLRERQDKLDDARSRQAAARYGRDQTAAALRRKLVEIRRFLTAVLGPRRTAELAGIEGETAKETQPAILLSQSQAILKLLRDPRRLAIPRSGCYFDPAAAAGALEPLAAACREACGPLEEIREARAATLEARNRARSELERGARCVAGILGGWLLLIRRTDLAEKLRAIHRSRKEVPM